jgi:polyvinyl alcohol dehydrogenase (cytochrome)
MRIVWIGTIFVWWISASGQDGAAIYLTRCVGCHDAAAKRVPPLTALQALGPIQILRSLDSGAMKTQAEGLSARERFALARYIGVGPGRKTILPPSAFCAGDRLSVRDNAGAARWSGWSPDFANTRFQSEPAAGLTASDAVRLKLKWAFGLGSEINARSQPAIAGGRLFVGTQAGTLYALDARTGCVDWSFQAGGAIRSPLVIGSGGGAAVYFGDDKATTYAIDAATGKLNWKVRVDDHFTARITAAPQLVEGVLFVPVSSTEEVLPPLPSYECCTFRGSIVALKAATGEQVWKTFTIPEPARQTEKNKAGVQMYGPSGAGIWSTPTFDPQNNALYVATGNNYSDPPTSTSDAVLALDRSTGRLLWTRQLSSNDAYNDSCGYPGKRNCPDSNGPDFDFGQPPILVKMKDGRRMLVIAQKSGLVYGLNPDRHGDVVWKARVGEGGQLGGSQWGSAADQEKVYVAISDLKFIVALDGKGMALQADPSAGGGLYALRVASGEKVWFAKPATCGSRSNCSPAQSAAVTAIPGLVFSGSVDGHLRGYNAETGEVVWDFDTVRDYETVNGTKAHGGSLDGPGPVLAGGMLFVNSGYGQFGGMPGNVLLAFSVDGK